MRRDLPMGFASGVLMHSMRSSCGSGLQAATVKENDQAPALLEPAV